MRTAALQPKHGLIKRRCVKMQTAVVKEASCAGGFCELPHKPASEYKQFLSNGEGIPPPLKIEEPKLAFKLSYPGEVKVESETISPTYLLWLGRRWYASP